MNSHKAALSTQAERTPERWVPEAAKRPVAFAQVREDAAIDQWVVQQLQGDAEVLMVAAGGCTAAALATMPQVTRLHLIDPNPAQIALARLKVRLLGTAEPSERLAILGHTAMPASERRARLTAEFSALGLPADALGPLEIVAETGPDHVGRYEIVFAKLRDELSEQRDELAALFQLRDPIEQARRVDSATDLGRALDAAFDSVMALPNLVALFGKAATRNRCEPFSRHFARRTRHVLATQPAAENPYLWQMLQGWFPNGCVYPWLNATRPERVPELTCCITAMAEALKSRKEAVNFVHLSNILDWLSPKDARATLDLTLQALRPGGWTIIRQLNSELDIPSLGQGFEWLDEPAKMLHQRDRSFFYRKLYLGRKR